MIEEIIKINYLISKRLVMPLVVYVSSAKAKLDRPPDKFTPPSG